MPSRGHLLLLFPLDCFEPPILGPRGNMFSQYVSKLSGFVISLSLRLWSPVLSGLFTSLPNVILDPKLCLFTNFPKYSTQTKHSRVLLTKNM